MDTELKQKIDDMVKNNKVFLFMKGTPDNPECGFSMKVANALKELNVEFKSFDVHSSMEIRQAVKEYSNWPTLPQLYINGEFVGGCDITLQLAQSGKLKEMIQ